MTHTPGPWAISRKATRRVTNLHGVGICNAVLRNRGGPNSKASIKSEVEAEANARLIAAAPALLLELEMTVELLERASRTLTEECKSVLGGRSWGGIRLASARSTIAAAKGDA